MKTMYLGLFTAMLVATAAEAGTCTNPGLVWTINSSQNGTPSAILSDGGDYVNGMQGVAAVMNVCGGSNDATLQLSQSSRTAMVSFTKVLATTSYTPSWAASGSPISGQWFLNVRNLGYVPAAGLSRTTDEYDFTTRYGSQVPSANSTYLRMLNPSTQAITETPLSAANNPYPDSKVNVHHCPGSTGNSTPSPLCAPYILHETWLVWPDQNPTAPCPPPSSTTATITGCSLPITQVASLMLSAKGSTVNAGEFSVPFYFVISLQ